MPNMCRSVKLSNNFSKKNFVNLLTRLNVLLTFSGPCQPALFVYQQWKGLYIFDWTIGRRRTWENCAARAVCLCVRGYNFLWHITGTRSRLDSTARLLTPGKSSCVFPYSPTYCSKGHGGESQTNIVHACFNIHIDLSFATSQPKFLPTQVGKLWNP